MIAWRDLLVAFALVHFAGCAGANTRERGICEQDLATVRRQNAQLQAQLTHATRQPARMRLNSPDIVELVSGTAPNDLAATDAGMPTLTPQDASRVVMKGAPALQVCYEGSLRINPGLGESKHLSVLLSITVVPTGAIERVTIDPVVDQRLVDCFTSEIKTWTFPKFEGSAVTLEQQVTLTPK